MSEAGKLWSKQGSGSEVSEVEAGYPSEVAEANITTFRGFQLFTGEQMKSVVGFLMVEELDVLHMLVKDNGWN